MTSHLPTGTVTFLFTDIEDSTRLWQDQPRAMAVAHQHHDSILRQAIEAHQGYIFQIVGDSFSAAFHHALDALLAAVEAQRALQDNAEVAMLRVRMGLHTGAAEPVVEPMHTTYDGYVTVASAQRVMSAAHGGQILFSQTTAGLLQNDLPAGISLRDAGEHRLKGLRAPLRLYMLEAPGLPQDFPPIDTVDLYPNNLPAQLTAFIGREKEIMGIQFLLEAARLVTLTGPGGTGKTRLALEAGREVAQLFPHGVWFVELAPLGDPAQIIPAMAQVFGLQELPLHPLSRQVVDYLRSKKSLLLLDNCEHLIEACAQLTDDLLHQCSGLKIIASSRESLGIAGERVVRVPPLDESEAVLLFEERARAVLPQFVRTDANAAAIARICARLDGIPLAIELAAARITTLSPEQIAARLDDRFRLLTGGSRTATPRQQTLRATIDWSYDLLSAEEQQLLQYASTFAGGWTLDALEWVYDQPNTLDLLEQLIHKSLVMTETRENEMRYFLLETLRQYGREKLFDSQQATEARNRHFAYFNRLSEWMWDEYRANSILPLASRAKDETENFRVALEWGLENDPEANLRLAANFSILSSLIGSSAEGFAVADSAIQRAQALPPAVGEAGLNRQKLIARAFLAKGMVGMSSGNMPAVLEGLREGIAISRRTGDRVILGYCVGIYYLASTFYPAPGGEEAAQEGLRIFSQEINDRFGLGLAYSNMARIAANQGNVSERDLYFEKFKALYRDAPETYQAAMFFLGTGTFERQRGNFQAAKMLFEEAMQVFNRLGSLSFNLVLQSEIGHTERQSGNLSQARSIYRETIRGWKELGNRAALAHQLESFGFLAIAAEEPERAIRLFGAAEALRERVQTPMTDIERGEYDQAVDRLRSMLAGPEFSSLWAEGRSLTEEQAVQLALAL